MSDKPMTTNDVRQMLDEQRAAVAPIPALSPDEPPVMTVEDVKRMLKGLPPLTEEEKAQAATPITGDPEKALEAETGKDVVKTGDDPPTYVETDKPAPKGKAKE
jgi:hypothetical protein